jgi:hypothetical protein
MTRAVRPTSPADPNYFLYAHELTWDELLIKAEQKIAVTTRTDTLLCSRDRKLDPRSAWLEWMHDVSMAPTGQYPRPLRPEVAAQLEQYQGQTMPPEDRKVLHLVTKEKPVARVPKFTWSLTAIQDFESCAKYFAHKKYFKDLPAEPDSCHLIEGRMFHDEAEACLKKRLLSANKTKLKSLDGGLMCDALNKYLPTLLKASEGCETLVEYQMCITEKMEPTQYKDWTNGWGRGGIDFAIIKPDKEGVLTANILDHKLGKKKDEDLQLLLYCAFLSLHRPDIERFVPKYIWYKNDEITGINPAKPQVITKEMIGIIWSSVLKRVARMQEAWTAGVFNASPGPLCNWRSCSKNCAYK